MARNFKNKPKDMKLSVYLIHTRLLAQGTVIGEIICSQTFEGKKFLLTGVLTFGMMHHMYGQFSKKYNW